MNYLISLWCETQEKKASTKVEEGQRNAHYHQVG